MTYRKRALTALVAGALALPFLATPASAGHGGPQAGPAQDITTFCENPFTENFTDVQATDVFALAIQCIATAGREIGQPITVGGPEELPPTQYGPNRGVLRGQMASFIARMLDAAESRDRAEGDANGLIQALPAYDGSNTFTDVPNNFVHVANINRLADAGIVVGGPGGRSPNIYAPNEFISRAQMASFINRAVAYAQGQNPNGSGTTTGYVTTSNFFVDSGEIAVHRANINGLASVGIVIGVQPESEHRYAPRANVTRAQMAGFISRTLSQLFEDDRIFSLLEVFSGGLEAADRGAQTFTTGTTQRVDFTDLKAGEEYRVTLVDCANVNRTANDLVEFTVDGTTGLAAAGTVNSRITGFGFGQSGNDAPAGTTNSAAVTPPGTTLSVNFVNDGTPECIVVVIYLNGGAGQSLEQGGESPRLNVDAQGRPIEFFGISGDINFAAPGDARPTIVDARITTDAAMATPGGTATGTASTGDVLQITFSEAVATDAAVATGAAFTVTDNDGDSAVIVCGLAVNATDNQTAADCRINGAVVTVTLRENADDTNTAGNGELTFPLTITQVRGFFDADEGRQEATTGTADVVIDRETT